MKIENEEQEFSHTKKMKEPELLDRIVETMIETDTLLHQYSKLQINGSYENFTALNGSEYPRISVGHTSQYYPNIFNIEFVLHRGPLIPARVLSFPSLVNYCNPIDPKKVNLYADYMLHQFTILKPLIQFNYFIPDHYLEQLKKEIAKRPLTGNEKENLFDVLESHQQDNAELKEQCALFELPEKEESSKEKRMTLPRK